MGWNDRWNIKTHWYILAKRSRHSLELRSMRTHSQGKLSAKIATCPTNSTEYLKNYFMHLTQHECTSMGLLSLFIHVKYSEKFFKTFFINRKPYNGTSIERSCIQKEKAHWRGSSCEFGGGVELESIRGACNCISKLDFRIWTHGRPKSDTTLTIWIPVAIYLLHLHTESGMQLRNVLIANHKRQSIVL